MYEKFLKTPSDVLQNTLIFYWKLWETTFIYYAYYFFKGLLLFSASPIRKS